jgi:GNAT superfamily N-acetyltransferase
MKTRNLRAGDRVFLSRTCDSALRRTGCAGFEPIANLLDVRTLEPFAANHHRAAAIVLADAFLDDPGWVAVGPRRVRARWKFIYRTCLGAIRVGAQWCGPSWCVVEDGEPVAVLTGCAPGLWPPPRIRALSHLARGPVLAGPAPLVRSLGAQRVIEAAHPAHDHFLVWMFAVSPSHQRRGLGRQLMQRALAKADSDKVPAYLWTGNPENLPYYRSHGFVVVGEAQILGGVANWFLERQES